MFGEVIKYCLLSCPCGFLFLRQLGSSSEQSTIAREIRQLYLLPPSLEAGSKGEALLGGGEIRV